MKKFLLLLYIMVLIFLACAFVAAQDYYSPMFAVFRDFTLPQQASVCRGDEVIAHTSAVVYDGTLMVHYVCRSWVGPKLDAGGRPLEQQLVDREVWRRYFRPMDQAPPPERPVLYANPCVDGPGVSFVWRDGRCVQR